MVVVVGGGWWWLVVVVGCVESKLCDRLGPRPSQIICWILIPSWVSIRLHIKTVLEISLYWEQKEDDHYDHDSFNGFLTTLRIDSKLGLRMTKSIPNLHS